MCTSHEFNKRVVVGIPQALAGDLASLTWMCK